MGNYEILGWEDILGMDSLIGDQLIGGDTTVPAISADSQAGRYALAMKAAQAKKLVSTRGPTKSRDYPVGFDSGATLIAAGAQVTVTRNPQVPFRGRRLAVAGSIAPSWLIDDIKVGKNSQFVTADGVPAEAFSQTAFGVEMGFDTAQVSMQISIQATNISLAPARFLATIIGDAVE